MPRVMVAEDHEDSRLLLVHQLRGAGYEVVEARDGAEALAQARADPPDLIFSDLMMPGLDGFMLLREWRLDPVLRKIPFIVHTATFVEPADEQLARDLGADDFMLKPMPAAELLERAAALLQRSSAGSPGAAQPSVPETELLKAYSTRLRDKLHLKLDELDLLRRAVREEDQLYSALFENNHLVMLLIEPDSGRIVDANPAAVAFYGWSREALRSRHIHDINTLSRAEIAAEMERAREGDRKHFVFRHRCADSEERDVEVYSGPIVVRGRRLLYSIVRDISTGREAEQRLAQSESLQRLAGRLAQVGGWAMDRTRNTLFWSEEVWRIHGLPPGDEVSLEEGINYYAPECREQIRAAFDACVTDGTPYDLELQIVRPFGERAWVRTLGEPMYDADGAIRGAHGAIQDITEQRRASERMRQLWVAVQQSPESIIVTDLEPRIVYANDAACRISGYSREELIGQNPNLLSSGDTPRSDYEEMWACVTSGQSWSGVFHNRRKSGERYTESVSITPVVGDDQQATHYLAIKEDITEKLEKEAELVRYRDHLEQVVAERTRDLAAAREEAELANRAKSSFLARMSHEIRTPLNGILGTIEILGRESLNAYQMDLLATIGDSGRILMSIINDVLDFSRIEAGALEIQPGEVDVAALVEDLCESMAPLALERGNDLFCFVAPDLPQLIAGDELRLRQVLANLLSNAVKFTAGSATRRGRIDVRALPGPSGGVALEVEDNGIGISLEAQKYLFQPFRQAEESTTRRFGGSGLGLAICKRLMEMMGGAIRMQSVPGEGSLARATLPVEVLPPAQDDDATAPDIAGLRVELVAADALPLEYFERYLEEAGVAVQVVAQASGTADVVLVTADSGEAADGPGTVLLAHDARRTPQVLGSRRVRLSVEATRRNTLLDAVAVAGGRRHALSTRALPWPEEAPLAAAIDVETAAARGELILVAEDDAINRKVVREQLKLLGRAAQLAADGEQALAMWRDTRPALLLTDLHMPGMDGYGLVRAIREEEARTPGDAGRPLPIIALTANALGGEAERARSMGFDGYLTKPVALHELAAVIDHYLGATAGTATGAAAPGSTGPAAPGSVLDVGVLKALIGDDDDAVAEFLRDFLASARGLLADVERACATSDSKQVAAVMHKLKSSSRSVGALALGEASARLEQAAKEGALQFDKRPAAELQAQLDAVSEAVAAWLGARPDGGGST